MSNMSTAPVPTAAKGSYLMSDGPAKLRSARRMAREPAAASPAAKPVPETPAGSPPRVPSKIEQVLALLRRVEGATLPEMIAATRWLPHTTRAALTGLRKKGHVLAKDKRGEVTCYRIAGAGE
jgi:predicted short-subunit dehydrogenase-like oxidoreductase (DUF2520 family)